MMMIIPVTCVIYYPGSLSFGIIIVICCLSVSVHIVVAVILFVIITVIIFVSLALSLSLPVSPSLSSSSLLSSLLYFVIVAVIVVVVAYRFRYLRVQGRRYLPQVQVCSLAHASVEVPVLRYSASVP